MNRCSVGESVLAKWTGRGTAVVEPMAFVTESGEWSSLPCASGTGKNCLKFEHDYLSKEHVYVVVTQGRHQTGDPRPVKSEETHTSRQASL